MWSDPALVAMFRWCLEALSLVLVVATALFVFRQWSEVPARVPSHFDFRGRPDRWAGRYVLLVMLGIMTATYVALSMNGGTLLLIEGNVEERMRQSFIMTYVKLHTMILLAYALWMMIRVARGQAKQLRIIVMSVIAGAMILPVYLLDRD